MVEEFDKVLDEYRRAGTDNDPFGQRFCKLVHIRDSIERIDLHQARFSQQKNITDQLQFHVGDRVCFTKWYRFGTIPVGTAGTIDAIDDAINGYYVKHDKGACWVLEKDKALELVPDQAAIVQKEPTTEELVSQPKEVADKTLAKNDSHYFPNQVQVQITQTGADGEFTYNKTLFRFTPHLDSAYPAADLWIKISALLDDMRKKYSGKVVCVKNSGKPSAFTCGKVYTFKDGFTKTDAGLIFGPVYDIYHLNEESGCEFIEFVE